MAVFSQSGLVCMVGFLLLNYVIFIFEILNKNDGDRNEYDGDHNTHVFSSIIN